MLRADPAFRDYVLELTRRAYADRVETESRFDRVLDELRRDREAQARTWEEQKREEHLKWEEQNRRWEEQNLKWEEQNRRWEELKREDSLKWAAHDREAKFKWDEQARLWEESTRKWQESGRRFDRVHEEIMAQARKFDRSIGALGARWGLRSEKAFRALYQVTDSELLAACMHWCATSPAARDEVFNITNTDYFRWENLWPGFARAFDMPPGGVQTIRLAEFMADKGPLWSAMQKRYDLLPIAYDQLVAWPFVDYCLTRDYDARWGDPTEFVQEVYRGMWAHTYDMGGFI